MVIFSCINPHRVKQIEKLEIDRFLNNFYENIETNFENCNVKDMFFKKNIEFYIQDNIENRINIINNNSEEEFLTLMNDFKSKSGDIVEWKIYKLDFRKHVYDIEINNLFIIKNDVIYENLKSFETFFLKKTEQGLQIYRYFINLN
jgi:hypothetical protein